MFTLTKLIHINTEDMINMIYPLAAYENCTLSEEDYRRVLAGEKVAECSDDMKRLIINLHDACTYMLDTLSDTVNVDYMYRINEILTAGRIEGEQMRDYEIGAEDLEYIQILRHHGFDLAGYDLSKLVPDLPQENELDDLVNISQEEYQAIVEDNESKAYEEYAYKCFMPIIKRQYFKKSNIITGALIVSKIVLQTKSHLLFLNSEHSLDLGRILLDCIYRNDDTLFSEFVGIMEKYHITMTQKNRVKVMIHLD